MATVRSLPQPLDSRDVFSANVTGPEPAFMQAARNLGFAHRPTPSLSQSQGRSVQTSYADSDGEDSDDGFRDAAISNTPASSFPSSSTSLPRSADIGGTPTPQRRPSLLKRLLVKARGKRTVTAPAVQANGQSPPPTLMGKVRQQGAQLLRRRVRISAKSPPDQWPKTYDAYQDAYARGKIDVNDPPPAPAKSTWQGYGKSPEDAQFLTAPRPANERIRQLFVNRFDPFGKRKRKQPAAQPAALPEPNTDASTRFDIDNGHKIAPEEVFQRQPGSEGFGDSLEGHVAFQRIVSFARSTFGTSLSMLSVFDGDQQHFLAESGLHGMKAIPRDIGFCSHTILGQKAGFVLLDTHRDWRFINCPLVTQYSCRFYAGTPILSPSLFGDDAVSHPLGTLCIVDQQPRTSFTESERRQLALLAEMARREIEAWHASRMSDRLAHMDREFTQWKAGKTGENQLTGTIPRAPSAAGDSFQDAVSRMSSPDVHANGHGAPETTRRKETCDAAVKLLSDELELDLTYLLQLDTSPSNSAAPTVLSAIGLPSVEAGGPAINFDPALHLRALRAKEKALLYQNPQAHELSHGEQLPTDYSSALLVPVADDLDNRRGYVLAGFVLDTTRVFGAEDLSFMQAIASELRSSLV